MAVEIFKAFEEFLQPARFKVSYGGRGSGKTRTMVTLAVDNVMHYGWRVICFREIMKSIDDSIYQEFVDEITRRDLFKWFDIYRNEIKSKSGGVVKFDGLHRNQQKIKGYSGFDLALLEEANNVSKESWKYLIPTFRKEGSEIWVIFNPEDPDDETYRKFVTHCKYPDYLDGKRYCIVKKINYTDNPRFPEELRIDMEIMKENDYELYRHVYLGEPVKRGELSIIKPKWIDAAIDAHVKLKLDTSGQKISALDVADTGTDKNAWGYRHGILLKDISAWNYSEDTTETANRAIKLCDEAQLNNMQYDCIGIGAGIKGETNRQHREGLIRKTLEFFPWSSAGKVFDADKPIYENDKNAPINKDFFENLKAQSYWRLSQRFYKTFRAVEKGEIFPHHELVSIPSDLECLDDLKRELSQPKRQMSKTGKLMIEKTPEGTQSPNLADCVVMMYNEYCSKSFFFV